MKYLGTYRKQDLRLDGYIKEYTSTTDGNSVILCFNETPPHALEIIAFDGAIKGDYFETYEEFQFEGMQVENASYVNNQFSCSNMDNLKESARHFANEMLNFKKSLLNRMSQPLLPSEMQYVESLSPSVFITSGARTSSKYETLETLSSLVIKMEQEFNGLPADVYRIVMGDKIFCTLNNRSVAQKIFSFIKNDIKSIILKHWAFLGGIG